MKLVSPIPGEPALLLRRWQNLRTKLSFWYFFCCALRSTLSSYSVALPRVPSDKNTGLTGNGPVFDILLKTGT